MTTFRNVFLLPWQIDFKFSFYNTQLKETYHWTHIICKVRNYDEHYNNTQMWRYSDRNVFLNWEVVSVRIVKCLLIAYYRENFNLLLLNDFKHHYRNKMANSSEHTLYSFQKLCCAWVIIKIVMLKEMKQSIGHNQVYFIWEKPTGLNLNCRKISMKRSAISQLSKELIRHPCCE